MKIRHQTKLWIESKLLAWFSQHKRDMPWRKKKSAYGTLVSEVMLQQTQIKTVIPYYERWLKEFPTLESFARAPIDRVLKLWEGLGYYSRARNLHKTAQIILEKHGGIIPSDPETLITLPGIGRYTAGAIASIGFGVPAPIVDGNVARVLSRIFLIKEDIMKPASQKLFYEIASQIVSKTHAGDFNQALMELGSLVCFPVMPQCAKCPISSICKARKQNLQERLPVKGNRLKRKKIHIASAIIRNNGSIVVQKRNNDGIWGSLWELPNVVSTERVSADTLKQVLSRELGLRLRPLTNLHGLLLHKLTHMDTAVSYYGFESNTGQLKNKINSRRWADREALSELSFPVPYQKILQTIIHD